MPVGEKPPARYIAHDVCPFECCFYGQWGVRDATSVFSEPFSDKVVGTASAGKTVDGVTDRHREAPEPDASRTRFFPSLIP